MKSSKTTQNPERRTRSASAAQQKNIDATADGLVSPGRPGQRKHREMIDGSPYLAAQRKRLTDMSDPAVQRQTGLDEEEELMQGKFTAQRQPPEEEELMQGKFAAQRQPPEEEELMQGKFTAQRQPPEEEELMQGKFTAQRQPPEEEEEPILGKFAAQAKQPNETGMPDELKTEMETSFDTDFSGVRVHPNSPKAPEVGALAYTQGSDVHFAPGQFTPESSASRRLLGHELSHVVQQRDGRVQPTTEVAGLPVNDSPDLEKEADDMGAKASR